MKVFFVDDSAPALRALDRFCAGHTTAGGWHREYFGSPATVLAALESGACANMLATDFRLGVGRMSGLDLVRALRTQGMALPTLLYSALEWNACERAECLRAGATDVMHMPFMAVEEFIARIERLGGGAVRVISSPRIEVGDVVIDGRNRSVTIHGAERALTPSATSLLSVLAAVSPRAATFAELLAAMGYQAAGSRHTVAEGVRQLRLQLDGSALRIEPVPRVGYRLAPPQAVIPER